MDMNKMMATQMQSFQDMTWEEFEKSIPPLLNNPLTRPMIKANFEKMKQNPEQFQ